MNASDRQLPPTRERPAESAYYDPAVPVEVHTSIVIAAEERSGSSPLAHALWLTGRAGLPAEYVKGRRLIAFRRRWGQPVPSLRGRLRYVRMALRGRRPPDFGERYRPGSVPPFLQALASRRSTPNGVFSLKTMWGDFDRLVARHGIDPAAVWGRTVWIRLSRRDQLRQAVSGVRATATGRFTANDLARASEPAYDREAISQRLRANAVAPAGWNGYLASHAADHLDLWYEDLAGTLAAVFDAAGIEPPSDWPEAPLKSLADERTEDWVERYQAGG